MSDKLRCLISLDGNCLWRIGGVEFQGHKDYEDRLNWSLSISQPVFNAFVPSWQPDFNIHLLLSTNKQIILSPSRMVRNTSWIPGNYFLLRNEILVVTYPHSLSHPPWLSPCCSCHSALAKKKNLGTNTWAFLRPLCSAPLNIGSYIIPKPSTFELQYILLMPKFPHPAASYCKNQR